MEDQRTYGVIIDLTRQPGGRDLNITNNSYPQGTTGDAFAEQFRQSRYTSKSAFGSLTVHLTDTLSATAGARHIWDSVSEHTFQYDAGSGGLPLLLLPAGLTCASGLQCDSAKFLGWAYNGSIEWRPTNRTRRCGSRIDKRWLNRSKADQSRPTAPIPAPVKLPPGVTMAKSSHTIQK